MPNTKVHNNTKTSDNNGTKRKILDQFIKWQQKQHQPNNEGAEQNRTWNVSLFLCHFDSLQTLKWVCKSKLRDCEQNSIRMANGQNKYRLCFGVMVSMLYVLCEDVFFSLHRRYMGWFFVSATDVYLLSQRCEYLIRFVGCIRLHSHIVRYTVNSNTVRLQWTLDFCTMFALITYATYDIAGLVSYLRIIIFEVETS